MNTKILISLLVIGLTAVAIGGAMTGAFFSDTETSKDNTFVAGEIDLKINSECHYNGNICKDGKWEGASPYPVQGTDCDCTWLAMDLTGQPILNFNDVKPGDEGESTISIHVTSNPAWVCAKISGLANADNACNEPELEAESEGDRTPTCGDPGVGEGELQNVLLFDIWRDYDCENDFDGEDVYLVRGAKATDLVWPIADARTGEAVQPGVNYCIAVAWSIPAETGNIIQSDSVKADISFYAVQERNNKRFLCVSNGGICEEKADVMSVIDRSGSVAGSMATMKTAAHAFVTALDPKADGVHMGQTSFATSGSLDLSLTDNKAAIDAAIDALVSSGNTNLYEGILLANQELAGANDRPDATSPDYMVIITDGETNEPTNARGVAQAQADAADAAGTKIYVVGVGVVPDTADWLKNNIATDPTYYYDVADYSGLQAILEKLAECNGKA